MSLPSGWPRSRLEMITAAVVFAVGLVIIVSIRLLTGPPSSNQPGVNPPQARSTSGTWVTARDEAACMELSTGWAEFRASGSPRWDEGVDLSSLTAGVRDAFASVEEMSAAHERTANGTGTADELQAATDAAAATTTAGCGFDPQLSDRIGRN